MEFIVLFVMFILFCIFWFLYGLNVWKIIKSSWTGSEIKIIFRVIGIFFPLLGAVMGLVKV